MALLYLSISPPEMWDERKEEFVYIKPETLRLEHSLISISKWEQKWQVAFLDKKTLTLEETIDYVKCMTLTQNANPLIYNFLTSKDIQTVSDYIRNPMTASTFSGRGSNGKQTSRKVTSELIYYWMLAFNIPFECEKWNLNRLLTLIRICNEENQPKKNMSTSEILRSNSALNSMRRKQLGTRG